ncbi:MAG: class I SAM-dependent methyltransferase [Gemmatimonadota bacterium]
MGAPPLTAAAWLRYDAIQRGLKAAAPRRVLEVGAGEGAMAWRLARRFDYTGLEPDTQSSALALRRLRSVGGRLLAGTTELLLEQPAEEPYDLICAFEVLEHVEDDVAELVRWRRLLRPNGWVLLSVPAHRRRFGPADVAVGHWRRYDREDLERALHEANLDIVWIEAWGAGLGHLLEWIRSRAAADAPHAAAADATARSGRWLQPRNAAAGLATAAAALPFRLLGRVRRGLTGIGWVALARRPA